MVRASRADLGGFSQRPVGLNSRVSGAHTANQVWCRVCHRCAKRRRELVLQVILVVLGLSGSVIVYIKDLLLFVK